MPANSRSADEVTVPDVVGMTVDAGRRLATEAGVALAPPDADGPPLGALTWPGIWTITQQHPAPGSTVFRWDSVVVHFTPGGDGPAGVREPRRPGPRSSAAAAARPSVPR